MSSSRRFDVHISPHMKRGQQHGWSWQVWDYGGPVPIGGEKVATGMSSDYVDAQYEARNAILDHLDVLIIWAAG